MARRLLLLAVLVSLVVACTPEEAELTTTTTTVAAVTTTVAETTTTTSAGSDDDPAAPAITDYEVVVRSSTAAGEAWWILIEPGDYSDVDLENLIRELVDTSDVTLAAIYVFDDLDALEAGRIEEGARTAEEQELVDEHFLVSLVDGAIIRFEGPYAEFGETVVGS